MTSETEAVSGSPDQLSAIVSSVAAPMLELGKAVLESRQVGAHLEFEITPVTSTACPITVVDVVPTDVTLSVGIGAEQEFPGLLEEA